MLDRLGKLDVGPLSDLRRDGRISKVEDKVTKIKCFLNFLRELGLRFFGISPVVAQPSPAGSAAPIRVAPVPARTWKTMTLAELDPFGITTARRGHFNPRWDMVPATRRERQMREFGAAARGRSLI